VTAVGNAEAVNLREVDWIDVTEERGGLGGLLVPDIADALEEEQRQDVGLPVGAVDGAAAQDLGAVPEVGLQLLEGQGYVGLGLARGSRCSSGVVASVPPRPITLQPWADRTKRSTAEIAATHARGPPCVKDRSLARRIGRRRGAIRMSGSQLYGFFAVVLRNRSGAVSSVCSSSSRAVSGYA
jgi:hypothetical protein